MGVLRRAGALVQLNAEKNQEADASFVAIKFYGFIDSAFLQFSFRVS